MEWWEDEEGWYWAILSFRHCLPKRLLMMSMRWNERETEEGESWRDWEPTFGGRKFDFTQIIDPGSEEQFARLSIGRIVCEVHGTSWSEECKWPPLNLSFIIDTNWGTIKNRFNRRTSRNGAPEVEVKCPNLSRTEYHVLYPSILGRVPD